jgi:DNA-binding response OmpR family regulator
MATILVVDDQPCVLELVSEELTSEGHRVTMARDAESVNGHFKFCRPDLVILDLHLDGPNGIVVLHDIKRQHPGLPVIIFTAYDSYREDPRVSQADGYVVKNTVFDELKETVTLLLDQRAKCGPEFGPYQQQAHLLAEFGF